MKHSCVITLAQYKNKRVYDKSLRMTEDNLKQINNLHHWKGNKKHFRIIRRHIFYVHRFISYSNLKSILYLNRFISYNNLKAI